MLKQLRLPFIKKNVYRNNDFIVSGANSEAFSWIEKWQEWPNGALFLTGPESSGKTHLANIWQRKTGAVFLRNGDFSLNAKAVIADNIEDWHEQDLFHLINIARESRTPLLLTSRRDLSSLPFILPDLLSRLKAMQTAELKTPDDILLKALLAKQFSDRQLKAGPEIIDFLVARAPRSFAGISQLVDKIDERAIEEKRNITIPFLRDILSF